MLPRAGTVRGVDVPQGRQEPGQVNREPDGIGDTARAGLALRERYGHRQREPGSEHRKPLVFLLDCQCVFRRARQAHQHPGAEVKRPVIPAAVGNGLNRQTGPLRELLCDQTTHPLRIDGDSLWCGTEIRRITQRNVLSPA